MARIAEHAGINRGLISYHFAGKDELIAQVLVTVFGDVAAYMGSRVEAESKAAGQLRSYIESNLAYMSTHREELASQGYVVAGIDHTYESSGTELPGGRFATCVACERAEYADVPPVRATDTSFVVEQLTRGSAWSGGWTIDPRRIGMAGHSIGGNAAAEAMRTDPRIDAGVNLDGTFFTQLPPDGLDRPFLLLGQPEAHLPGDQTDPSWDAAWQRLTGWRRWFTVTGTVHISFSDFAPLAERFGLPLAPLDGDRTDEIVRAYLTAFFDQHLRGIPQSILDGTHPRYPEVIRHALTTLALSAGKPVSVDRLTTAVWGDDSVVDARVNLQTNVRRLPRLLGAELVTTRGSGYALEVEPGQVDALRFARLLDEAAGAPDPETRRDRTRRAERQQGSAALGGGCPRTHGCESR